MSYFVGAYVASPALHNPWNPDEESVFMASLRDNPLICGLEIGFYDDLHKHDTAWFLQSLRPDWDYVVTSVPGTMDRLAANPVFGLASTDTQGRRAAIEYANQMRIASLKLNEHCGRSAVKAALIHSAPRQRSSHDAVHAFTESLSEINKWDWGDTQILVEHCDSYRTDHPPAKGFLTLANEIGSIHSVGSDKMGMVVNWGRSALEFRDPEQPKRDLETLKEARLLRGLMFSGCTAADPVYGEWADTHAPFAPAGDIGGLETSLMTAKHAAECLGMIKADDSVMTGIKIQPLPASLDVSQRLAMIDKALQILEKGER